MTNKANETAEVMASVFDPALQIGTSTSEFEQDTYSKILDLIVWTFDLADEK